MRVALDPSGGRHDRAALAVGFRDRESDRIVIAALRAWGSPHDPSMVIREVCAIAREYGAKVVHLDRYAGDTLPSLVRAEGLAAESFTQSSSDLLMDLLPVVSSGGIELQDPMLSTTAAELMRELRSVERRAGGAGRDRAEIPRGIGTHGDLAAAVAGLASLLPAKRARVPVAGRGLNAAQPRRSNPFASYPNSRPLRLGIFPSDEDD